MEIARRFSSESVSLSLSTRDLKTNLQLRPTTMKARVSASSKTRLILAKSRDRALAPFPPVPNYYREISNSPLHSACARCVSVRERTRQWEPVFRSSEGMGNAGRCLRGLLPYFLNKSTDQEWSHYEIFAACGNMKPRRGATLPIRGGSGLPEQGSTAPLQTPTQFLHVETCANIIPSLAVENGNGQRVPDRNR